MLSTYNQRKFLSITVMNLRVKGESSVAQMNCIRYSSLPHLKVIMFQNHVDLSSCQVRRGEATEKSIMYRNVKFWPLTKTELNPSTSVRRGLERGTCPSFVREG